MIRFLVWMGIMAGAHLLARRKGRIQQHYDYSGFCPPPAVTPNDFVLKGKQAGIKPEDVDRILKKRYPFYNTLEEKPREKFRKRVSRFLNSRIFIFRDEEAYREMPVLVSASAVHLTFGLHDYLLPFYKYIRIYPREYMAADSFRVLAGNVQSNTITIAWNHLLRGNEDPADGSNLGLHEMSHALYMQKMVIEENYAIRFSRRYRQLLDECHAAHGRELQREEKLYSDYAITDLQEFWAESVELFFEKPLLLKKIYPRVYEAMTRLLNQDPMLAGDPVLHNERPFVIRMKHFAEAFFRDMAGKAG